MIVRNLWLLVIIPTLVLLVITETSGWDRWNIAKDEHNTLKTSDAKTKKIKHEPAGEKNFVDDPLKKKSPIKVILWKSNDLRDKERITAYDRNGEDGGRFRRNAIVLDELKDSKKSYAKMKLAQTQSAFKNWKNKEGGKYVDERTTKKRIDRRQANYYAIGIDGLKTGRSKRFVESGNQKNDKSDYFAQRKAVMDKFYARQKQIAEKYASRLSTTPKYIYVYDLETKTNSDNTRSLNKAEETNSVFNGTNNDFNTNILDITTTPFTTIKKHAKQVQPVENSPEVNNEEDVSDDYDDYALNDSKPSSDANAEDGANIVLNDEWAVDDSRNGTLKWGDCGGKLVYQHNLILNISNSSSIEVNLTASFEGPFCFSCVRVIPVDAKDVTASIDVVFKEDGTFRFAKLTLKSFQQTTMSYVVKIWAVGKIGDRCDKIKT